MVENFWNVINGTTPIVSLSWEDQLAVTLTAAFMVPILMMRELAQFRLAPRA